MKKHYETPILDHIRFHLNNDILVTKSIETDIPVIVETLPPEEPSEWDFWDDLP